MDIELKLREMLILRDPGVRFTDNVLSRVGDVPDGQSRDGVVRLADARTSRRGRRILLGALVVVGAAAAMLPFLPGRNVDAPGVQEVAALAATADGSPAADSDVPMVKPVPSADGGGPLDCVDPDVLRGLLLPGPFSQTFRITSAVPPDLAAFEPPRQLIWLGGTERGADGVSQSSVVYRTSLTPDAARNAAVSALTAKGWKLQSDGRFSGMNLFVSGSLRSVGETYCREGRPVSVMASALDGVTYVVLTVSRTDSSAGFANACDQPAQPMFRTASPIDEYLPTLELPRDPATGQLVAMRGGGGSSGEMKRRASASFTLKDSVDGVARHFASQMAGQGWQADVSWSGAGTAGSTWTRRLDDDTVLQGMLAISAFEDDRFTAVFSVVGTK